MAHKQVLDHPIVIVKQQRCTNSSSIKGLAPCSHENTVSLQEIFCDEDVVFSIYECMDVSLADIQSARYGNLASYQIAAVRREVWHLGIGVESNRKEILSSFSLFGASDLQDGLVSVITVPPRCTILP